MFRSLSPRRRRFVARSMLSSWGLRQRGYVGGDGPELPRQADVGIAVKKSARRTVSPRCPRLSWEGPIPNTDFQSRILRTVFDLLMPSLTLVTLAPEPSASLSTSSNRDPAGSRPSTPKNWCTPARFVVLSIRAEHQSDTSPTVDDINPALPMIRNMP